jgi:hypothetical protein
MDVSLPALVARYDAALDSQEIFDMAKDHNERLTHPDQQGAHTRVKHPLS